MRATRNANDPAVELADGLLRLEGADSRGRFTLVVRSDRSSRESPRS